MEPKMNQPSELRLRLQSLAVFRRLLSDPVLKKFNALLTALSGEETEALIGRYSDFAAALYEYGVSFSSYLLTLALEDENVYMLCRAREKNLPQSSKRRSERNLRRCARSRRSAVKRFRRSSGKRDLPDFCPDGNAERSILPRSI